MPQDDRVTLRDVYDAVNRIEDKFEKRLSAIEKDVDELKGFQNRTVGLLSIVALFAGAASNFIWGKVTGQA